jgi:O-antigen ligase
VPGLERPFSTPKLWLAAAMAAWAGAWMALSPERGRLPGGHWVWLGWLGAVGFSASLASDVEPAALGMALAPLLWCWAAARGGEWLGPALRWASLAESVVVLLQWAGFDPFGWAGWQAESFANARMRVYGTLGNPNFAAAWLCATLPLQLRGPAGWLQVAAIAATGSRAALFGLGVAAAVLAAGRMREWRRAALALPVVVAALWLAPVRPVGETVRGRWDLARTAAARWRDVPLTGVGPGSFEKSWARWRPDPLDHAHNDYVEIWVEYGAVGAVAFGLLLAALARGRVSTALAGAAALAAMACVDFPFHRPAEWALLWLLLGMANLQKNPDPLPDS